MEESTLDLLQQMGATINGGRISISLKQASDKLRVSESILRDKLGLKPKAKPAKAKPPVEDEG